MGKNSRSRAKKNRIQMRKDAGNPDPNKHECLFCNCMIPNDEGVLNDHYNGKKHKRLEKLQLYKPFFEEEGLIPSVALKTYECQKCGQCGIPADVKKLKAHLLDVHFVSSQKQYPNLLSGFQQWYTGSEELHIIRKVQKIRPKTFWVNEYDLADHCYSYENIASPTLCVDVLGSTFHFLLVNGRFSCDVLEIMTQHATFLEAEGNATKRGEMKRSNVDSRIVTFGHRYAYGQIGRFRHAKQGCYSRADELCSLISDQLKQHFPVVFDHLEAILREEGITEEDNIRLGNSPFTAMSVTRDYNCNIHMDSDDTSYGFFVWFGAHGTRDKSGNEVRFYLPGVKLFTVPQIGDVFLCKANELTHCTKTVGRRGQFGVALFQKASFFRWFAILKSVMFTGTAVHDKLLSSWLESCSIEY